MASAPARARNSLLALGLVSLAGPALAAPPRIIKSYDIAQRKESPTFASVSRIRIVDRGALVFLGHGLWKEQHLLHFVEVEGGRRFTVEAPLAAFVKKRFPELEGSGFPKLKMQRLAFYDRKAGRAALIVRHGRRGDRKTLYLRWSLKSGTITSTPLLASQQPRGAWTHFTPLGYLATKKAAYLLRRSKVSKEGGYDYRLIALAEQGAPRELLRWSSKRSVRVNHLRAGLMTLGGGILVPEYAERPVQGPPPVGKWIDLESGSSKTFPVPTTPYGVARSADGRFLYLYSSQEGEVWKVDFASGKLLKKRKVGTRGHCLAFLRPGKLMLIRHKGLQLLDPKTLRRKRLYPLRKLLGGGFIHIEGSMVIGVGKLLLKNKPKLYLVGM